MNLRDLRLIKCDFALNLSYSGKGGEEIETGMSLEAFHSEDKRQVVALMTIKTEGKNIPYAFNIQYGIRVDMVEEDQEFLDRICNVNIPAIIFPYLREFVGDLTRRAGFPPLLLQPVNFVRAAEQKHTQAQK